MWGGGPLAERVDFIYYVVFFTTSLFLCFSGLTLGTIKKSPKDQILDELVCAPAHRMQIAKCSKGSFETLMIWEFYHYFLN